MTSIIEEFHAACECHRTRSALFAEQTEYSYDAMAAEVAKFADRFRTMASHTDRLGILAVNSKSYVAAYYGALEAGLIPFLIDPALGKGDLSSISESCGLQIFAHGAQLATSLPPSIEIGPLDKQLILSEAKSLALSPPALSKNAGTFRFTSGTTGVPKCIEFSHEAVVSAARNWQRGTNLTQDSRTLCLATFANGLAFNTSLLATFMSGAELSLYGGLPNSGAIQSRIKARGITRLVAFPLVFRILAEAASLDEAALASLSLAISAGAPMEPEIRSSFEERYKTPIADYYGIAETGPVTFPQPGASDGLGAALPGVEIRIDADDQILVRTGSMANRYLNVPGKLDRQHTPDGFYRTGDKGRVTRNCLYIDGRLDNLINLAGRKIDPEDIEMAVRSSDGVEDCAAFADQDAAGNMFIHLAFSGASIVTEQNLRQYCHRELTAFKVPSAFTRLDRIPRSSSGKLRLAALMEAVEICRSPAITNLESAQ